MNTITVTGRLANQPARRDTSRGVVTSLEFPSDRGGWVYAASAAGVLIVS